MAFTATPTSIAHNGGMVSVTVVFDSGTGWTTTKTMDFPEDGSVSVLAMRAAIIAQGETYKTNIALFNTLQGYVGTSITVP